MSSLTETAVVICVDVRLALADFAESSKRIFTVSKKPTTQEFSTMAKVVGLGIIIISVIGYVIYLLFTVGKIG